MGKVLPQEDQPKAHPYDTLIAIGRLEADVEFNTKDVDTSDNTNLVENNTQNMPVLPDLDGGQAPVTRHDDEVTAREEFDSLLKRLEGVALFMCPYLIIEIRRLRMLVRDDLPQWGSPELPERLQNLSSPLFLKEVYADLIIDNRVSKALIREFDSDLMADVESYISQRQRRKRDLGDAAGLELISTRPVKKRGSREQTFEDRFGEQSGALVEAVRNIERSYRADRPTTLKR